MKLPSFAYRSPVLPLLLEEKVMIEVATVRFLEDKTTIPIPFVCHSGTKK